MDLNHLAVFAAVAEHSGFSAAAAKLGIPKSSVSRSIAQLEAAMGVQLVHRTTRRVSLSTAGSALYERVGPLLTTLEESVRTVPEREEEPSGDLRVTAAVDFGATILAEIVARFVARHPGVRVDVRLSNRLVDLVAEGFDVGLRISSKRLKDSSLVARNAGPISMQLFASPQYLARRGTPRTPRDLAGHDWVAYRGAEKVRLEGDGRPVEILTSGRIVCDEMFFVREAARSGAGIGWLPTFLVDAELASGALVRVLPRWNIVSGNLWIVWPGGRHLPRKVCAFRDFLLSALEAKPLAAH